MNNFERKYMLLGSVLIIVGFGMVLFAGKLSFDRMDGNGVEQFDSYTEKVFSSFEDGALKFFGFFVMVGGLISLIGSRGAWI